MWKQANIYTHIYNAEFPSCMHHRMQQFGRVDCNWSELLDSSYAGEHEVCEVFNVRRSRHDAMQVRSQTFVMQHFTQQFQQRKHLHFTITEFCTSCYRTIANQKNHQCFQAQLSSLKSQLKLLHLILSSIQLVHTEIGKPYKTINMTNCGVQKEQDKDDAHIIIFKNHSQIANLLHKFHHLFGANKPVQMSKIKSLADMEKNYSKYQSCECQTSRKDQKSIGQRIDEARLLIEEFSTCCRLVV